MRKKGFSLVEMMIVLAILALISGIIMTWFSKYNKTQAINRDTDTIVESLRQARNFTLDSKNASQYGVHFASSTVTVFTGSTYTAGDSQNIPFTLQTYDLIVDTNFTGNGYDVVFNKLTGETGDDGTVIISSPSMSVTKTVTIYKTGVVQSN